jgi:hypothetical protein
MWEIKKTDIRDLIYDTEVTYESTVFKKKLRSRNLEKYTVKIKPFITELDVEGYFVDLRTKMGSCSIIDMESDEYIKFIESGDLNYCDNHFIEIDKSVYQKVTVELEKRNWGNHIDSICSILKQGYFYQTLAIINGDNTENVKFKNEVLALVKLAFEGKTVNNIKLTIKDNINLNLSHKLTIDFVTNILAKSLYENYDDFEGFILVNENAIIDRKVSLQDFYRDITLFELIIYFMSEIKWIEIDGEKLRITNEQFEFLYALLVCGTIVDDEFQSNGSNIARNWFTRMLTKYPRIEKRIISDLHSLETGDWD